jgi:hypothetical protein
VNIRPAPPQLFNGQKELVCTGSQSGTILKLGDGYKCQCSGVTKNSKQIDRGFKEVVVFLLHHGQPRAYHSVLTDDLTKKESSKHGVKYVGHFSLTHISLHVRKDLTTCVNTCRSPEPHKKQYTHKHTHTYTYSHTHTHTYTRMHNTHVSTYIHT